MKRALVTLSTLVLALAAVSCGSSGGDEAEPTSTTDAEATTTGADETVSGAAPTRQDYVEALQSTFGTELETTDPCFSEAVVDSIGADRLAEANITPQQFVEDGAFLEELGFDDAETERLRADVEEALRSCGTIEDALVAMFAELDESFDVTPHLECAIGEFSTRMATVIVDGFSGEVTGGYDAGYDAGQAAIAACPTLMLGIIEHQAQAAGVTFTDEERTCILDGLQANVDQGVEVGADTNALLQECAPR